MDWVGIMNYKLGDIIGITGVMGAGKSYFAKNIFKGTPYDYDINIIEIDDIRRDLLWESNQPLAKNLRQEIIKNFNILEYDECFLFDRVKFTQYIFSNEEILKKMNFLCKEFFIQEIKNKCKEDKINLLIWVNLIEENYLNIINSIIFIDINEALWIKRNKNNSLFDTRIKLQTNIESKKELLNNVNVHYEVFKNE